MADLLPEKGMISQKISSFFKKTFAGGTGSILGGIFLGILVWIPLWDSGWDSGKLGSHHPISSKLWMQSAQNWMPSAQNWIPSAQFTMASVQNLMLSAKNTQRQLQIKTRNAADKTNKFDRLNSIFYLVRFMFFESNYSAVVSLRLIRLLSI